METIIVKYNAQSISLPSKPHPSDAAYDLVARETRVLWPFTATKLATGLSLEIPEDYWGLILSRSGMAGRNVSVLGGVIDPSYRGEIKVVLQNASLRPYVVSRGDRIAQLVLLPRQGIAWHYAADLSKTARGEGGFGSTGS